MNSGQKSDDSNWAVTGLHVMSPNGQVKRFHHLVLDFTGTLALDGVLLPGVADLVNRLAASLQIHVLTADTFGQAIDQLAGLPVECTIVGCGQDKADIVQALHGSGVIAVGNGRNDVPLFRSADLSIAVIGKEGAAASLLGVADVVVTNILDGLELLLHPKRLTATLRD